MLDRGSLGKIYRVKSSTQSPRLINRFTTDIRNIKVLPIFCQIQFPEASLEFTYTLSWFWRNSINTEIMKYFNSYSKGIFLRNIVDIISAKNDISLVHRSVEYYLTFTLSISLWYENYSQAYLQELRLPCRQQGYTRLYEKLPKMSRPKSNEVYIFFQILILKISLLKSLVHFPLGIDITTSSHEFSD